MGNYVLDKMYKETLFNQFASAFFYLLLALSFLFLEPSRLAAQDNIRVALEVSEDTGGIFQSNFRSALSSLGDVRFVDPDNNPDAVIMVVVLCEGKDCQSANQYSVSVSVERPIQEEALGVAINNVKDVTPAYLSYQDIQRIASRLWEYRTTEMRWAISWGRQKYEQAIRELVATIDTNCFDTVRISNRWWEAARSGDVQTANQLEDKMRGRKCF